MENTNIEPSDETLQKLWDELVTSSIRIGIVEPDGDGVIGSKAFMDHIDRMLEEDVMDERMLIIWKGLAKLDYIKLSNLESAWLITIGDFMISNNKFDTAEDGDWYNAMTLVTVLIRAGMAKEAAG